MNERNALKDQCERYAYGAIGGREDALAVKTSYEKEFQQIGRNAMPLIATFLLQFSLSSVTILFVGRLGAVELGGVSLANVTFTATSAVFVGMATCLDTLCPQAYGAGQYKLVGLYFQRGLAINAVFSIPIALLWWFSKSILCKIVDDMRLVEIAARYLRIMVACIPGYITFECGKKYLQAQNDFTTAQNILFACAPLNVLFNYLFVFKFGWGIVGAPIATTTTYTLMGVSIIFAVLRLNWTKREIHCWSSLKDWREIFKSWDSMIYLAVPGIIMIEAEFLAFETLTVLSAKFGTELLAAQSVAASIQSLTFQVPFSVSVAASNRIAYHIGTGNSHNCKVATRTTLLQFGSLIGVVNFLILVLGRNRICSFFTRDTAVQQAAAQILPIIGINQLYDAFNVLAAGCLRAQGRQRVGGYLNIVAYYAIGLPLALIMGFHYKLGLQGFWIGLGVGILILALGELYCIQKSNWAGIIHSSHLLHQEV